MTVESSGFSEIPELAASFEYIQELGRGGSSVVYLARRRETGEEVALKCVQPSEEIDLEALERITREAEVVGALHHPHIVRLIEALPLQKGGVALVLEFISGASLKDALRVCGPAPVPVAYRVLRDVALALDYAHRQHGLIHRDIKPENIYLDRAKGIALLSDFEIARAIGVDQDIARLEGTLGTPAYMSPEQIDGERVDERSDLFSLGLVAFHLLTGKPPWSGESLYSILYKQKNEDLPSLTGARPDAPRALIAAVEGLLHKDPEQRWPNARSFLGWLGPTGSKAESKAVREWLEVWDRGRPKSVEVDEHSPTLRVRVSPPRPVLVDVDPPPPPTPVVPSPPPLPAPLPNRRARRRLGASVLTVTLMGVALGGFLLAWREWRSTPSSAEAAFLSDGIESWSGASRVSNVGVGSFQGGLELVDGDNQRGTVGLPLRLPLLFRALDGQGQPQEGVRVAFEVPPGEGSVDPAVGLTEPGGWIRAEWTLGDRAGNQSIMARFDLADGVEVAAQAWAEPSEPEYLRVVSPSQERGRLGPAGQWLPDSLVVRVEDRFGNPVPDVPVSFATEGAGGTVAPAYALTDPEGTARALWSPGSPGRAVALARLSAGVIQLQAIWEWSGSAPPASAARNVDPPPSAPPSPALRLEVTPTVAVGGTHTCSLAGNGALECWGSNRSGQLGQGSEPRKLGPAGVALAQSFASVAAGVGHTCALSPGGEAHCWGENGDGQLGDGSLTARRTPTRVLSPVRFVLLSAGLSHTCGIAQDGSVHCWGGRGGIDGTSANSGVDRRVPVRVGLPFPARTLSSGWNQSCAVGPAGEVWCWGEDATGNAAPSRRILSTEAFVAVTVGASHACALARTGQVHCWGGNDRGQLGDGSQESRPETAAPIAGGGRFAEVSAGANHTCARTPEGAVFCWGQNTFGQLGSQDTTDRRVPVRVDISAPFLQIDAGGSHSCGRLAGGEGVCWGYNLEAQLGDGTRSHRDRPVRVIASRP